jgi:hypothetical protein
MTEIPVCWICCAISTSDNPVMTINEERICEECIRETAQIEEELGGGN